MTNLGKYEPFTTNKGFIEPVIGGSKSTGKSTGKSSDETTTAQPPGGLDLRDPLKRKFLPPISYDGRAPGTPGSKAHKEYVPDNSGVKPSAGTAPFVVR